MADKVFVARNGLVANGAFTANSTVVNAAAVTATSVNSASIFVNGVNVNTMISGNAATAYSNGTSYADTKAGAAYTNAIAISSNADNLSSGTVPNARLSSVVVNTSAAFTISGVHTHNANIIMGTSAALSVNGSFGTAGQLLSSNGTGLYWTDIASIGTNTSASYSWTNSHIFSNTVSVNNSTFSVGNTTVNTQITLGTITLSNGAAVATVNSTVYNGTANNASFLSGTSLSTIQGQITGNAATAYTNSTAYSSNATNLTSGTVASARLGTGTANSTTVLYGNGTWALGGTVTSVSSGTGLTGGPITGSGTLSLATAGAGAASYSSGISAITVDAYGRVTSVTGSAGYGTGTVTSVSAGTGLSGGPITGSGSLSLATAGAGAATYSSGISAMTVDAYGRVTSVTGSASYITASSPTISNATLNGNTIFADAQFYNRMMSSNPVINFDSTDYIEFQRTNNRHVFYVGGSGIELISASGTQTTSFGVGTAPSGTTGEIRATNNITAYYSDMRLKTNIHPIQNALSKVKTISGVTYQSNDVAAKYGYTDQSSQVGVLAQQIEAVLPQAVKLAPFDTEYVDGIETSKSGENYKTVQYEKIIPLLIEAIKELTAKVEDLESKVR